MKFGFIQGTPRERRDTNMLSQAHICLGNPKEAVQRHGRTGAVPGGAWVWKGCYESASPVLALDQETVTPQPLGDPTKLSRWSYDWSVLYL